MSDSGVEVVANAAASPDVKDVEGAEDLAVESAPQTASPSPDENPSAKRKLEDLEPHEDDEAPLKRQEISAEAVAEGAVINDGAAGDDALPGGEVDGSGVDAAEVIEEVKDADEKNTVVEENEAIEPESENADAEKLQEDGGINGSGVDGADEARKDAPAEENGQLPSAQDSQTVSVSPTESSRRIEVPNAKVGVLIGKAGDTIKFLQFNSGAKIQITRDAEVDPHSSTRPVEILGTPEQVSKAEKLIKDVIAEAEAGGSPSLVARGFGTIQSGGDQTEIKVPNDKVGVIIGKGGETIKNLQTRSGARIQLIPQHLPEGDASKERVVRITGNKKQIETAKEMIKDAMNQMHVRPSSLSGGYNQHGFRPRGPAPMPYWGARPTGPTQPSMGYDLQQRGMYPPPQTTQYHQSYGGYSQQPPPRGGFSSSWDQRSGTSVQNTPHTGGYDYYAQGSHGSENPPSNLIPNPAHLSTPASVNYNYGQSQPPSYGQPSQHSYGSGYNEPKYDNQAPGQHYYGQQPLGAQPGPYGQQATAQPGYGQQQSYGPPTYGPPRATQPGDPMYQGSAPSSYPTQQSYPYGSTAPQPAPAYSQPYPASGAMDGYAQPPAAYSQHGGQAATGYSQGQPASVYTQPSSQPGAYGQYPTTQQTYADPGSGNVNYPYHSAPTDASYASAGPSSGYGAAPQATSQPGYAQPATNPSVYYDQSVPPQAAYAGQQ